MKTILRLHETQRAFCYGVFILYKALCNWILGDMVFDVQSKQGF
jgi:hypothetical protein